MHSYPLYLANRPLITAQTLVVTDKFSGAPMARVAQADAALLDQALAAGVAAAPAMAVLPIWRRQEILDHAARRCRERAEELATLLVREAGKPLAQSRTEVSRLIETFRLAAAEAGRPSGEILPLDLNPRTAGFTAMTRRVPVGLCAFISPYNFPLNLAAHKIAPAIAAGCPFVLKPASLTPISALVLGEILAECDLPPGAFSILPASREVADTLVTDPRPRLLSFTGSAEVGWDLKARAGRKKVVLELGGNAAVIVAADADLDLAAKRCAFGAFYQAGQSCISVQRILVHESCYEAFRERLLAATAALPMGDPGLPETVIGPLISDKETARVEAWIAEALAAGATRLCGGPRQGCFIPATVLEAVPRTAAVVRREVFGPVVVLSRFSDPAAAIAEVNDSDFGLQAGVFTRDLNLAQVAWRDLEVGGVIINEIPAFRADHMPYGGVKDSGLGREGLRWAMDDMSELRLLVLRQP